MAKRLFVLAVGVAVGAGAVMYARRRAAAIRDSVSVENLEGRAGQAAEQLQGSAQAFWGRMNEARKAREKELRGALFADNADFEGGAKAAISALRNRRHHDDVAEEYRATGRPAVEPHFSGVRPGDENDPLDDF